MIPPVQKNLGRRAVFAVLACGLGLFAVLGALEIVFRFFPVNSGLKSAEVDAAHPVFHFAPNRPYTFSRGWDLAMANRGRVNNAGFVNANDYRPDPDAPLLAVIGDSYVEALMLPFEQTLAGRLGQVLPVYSFAASGAPLSQYLVWADHARKTYRPRAMVFVVVGNDFDESLMEVKNAPGFHYYARDAAGVLALRRVDKKDGFGRALARKSALLRYIALNLEGMETFRRIGKGGGEAAGYVGNTSASAEAGRISKSREAVDAFFRDLPEKAGLPPGRILFLVDGLRPALYAGEEALKQAETSYFGVMRGVFMEKARALGYGVTDMGGVFRAEYLKSGQHFEWERDYHWNSLGHEAAANAVLASPVAGVIARLAGQNKGKEAGESPAGRRDS
jgi:hypothetical protein